MGAFDPGTNTFDQLAVSNPQFANGAPGLAYDAFTSPDPDTAVPALAQSVATTSASDAINDHAKSQDGFGLWNWLGARITSVPGLGSALDYLNKPLQEVQKDYKFVHSVYSRHGFMAGLLVTTGVVGAGAVGSLAGPEGAILAAELGASGARRLLGQSAFQDSYNDSENPLYQVSFGRDVANALSHAPGLETLSDTNAGLGKYVSGGVDALADLSTDPVVVAGKIPSLVRGGEYLGLAKPAEIQAGTATAGLTATHPLLRYAPIQQFLVQHSTRAITPEGIDVARYGTATPHAGTQPLSNGYNKAVEDIARSDAGTIIRNYPPLRGLAADLGKLDSGDAVHQYLRSAFTATDFYDRIYGPAILPSRTLMRPLADKLRAGAWNVKVTDDAQGVDRANALDQRGMLANQRNVLFPRRTQQVTRDGEGNIVPVGQRKWIAPAILPQNQWGAAIGGAIAKKVRTFTGYGGYAVSSKLNDLSGRSFDLLDPEALEGMRRNINYALGDTESSRIVGEMAQMQRTGDLSGLRNLWHSTQVDIVKAAGVPADNDVMAKVLNQTRAFSDTPGGVSYANDHMGLDHSNVLTDTGTRTLAVDADQTNSRAAFVDFRALKTAVHDMTLASKVYGKADDFYSSKLINGFFKPLALMTLGFATRVASAEAIPAMMRYGGVKMLKARVATTASQMGYKLIPGEAEHAAVAALLGQPGVAAHDAMLSALTPDDIRHTIDTAREGSAWGGAAMKVRSLVAPQAMKWGSHLDPEAFDTAVRTVLKHGGHVGNEITQAGHLADFDVAGRAQQAVDFTAQKLGAPSAAARVRQQLAAGNDTAARAEANKWTTGDQYGLWYPHQPHFDLHWTLELQKMSQQLPHQQIARDVLERLAMGDDADAAYRYATHREAAAIAGRSYDAGNPDFMGAPLSKADDLRAAERSTLERYRIIRPDGVVGQDPLEFATDRVARLRGATTGKDGTIHSNFLDQISRGEKPSLDSVEAINREANPFTIQGHELVPLPGRNLLNRITQYGFRHVVDPVINSLSRQPLYTAAVTREMRSLRFAVSKGLSLDDAHHIAEVRATHAILPQIHNTALRTQFSMMANSYLPFYFAQEQAIKRVLHLFHDNPAAMRQYQMLYEGLNNTAFVNNDGQGNRYLMLPGLGAIGNAVINMGSLLGLDTQSGLPLSVQGDMQSLKTVVPEMQMPGVSPFVSFAAQEIAKFNPAWERSLTGLVGSQAMTGDVLDWAIPSSPIRNIVRGLRADETDRAYLNAMNTAIAAAYYHDQVPGANASPAEKQAFIDRIKNNAKSVFMVKAIYGMLSPLAPQVSESDFTSAGDSFTEEFQKMVTAHKGDYNAALQQFMAEHGSRAVSYTVAKSEATTPGAYMPYTNQAINWLEQNKNLAQSALSTGAAFLIPQAAGGGNAQAIHDELIAMNLRARRTPEDFLHAVYVAAGNNIVAPAAQEHAALVKQFEDAGDTANADAEKQRWSQFIAQYGIANPEWYGDYQSSDKTHLAQLAISNLQAIFANPDKMGPNFETSQVASVRALYNDYVGYKQQLLDAHNFGTGSTSQIKASWKDYLNNVETTQPTLAPIVRSVFMRLATFSG